MTNLHTHERTQHYPTTTEQRRSTKKNCIQEMAERFKRTDAKNQHYLKVIQKFMEVMELKVIDLFIPLTSFQLLSRTITDLNNQLNISFFLRLPMTIEPQEKINLVMELILPIGLKDIITITRDIVDAVNYSNQS